jgi:hypothetical protein
VARDLPSSTLLQDGTVLVAGGQTASAPSSAADIYNPASGTFTPANGTLQVARAGHTATLLGDGTVLIVGGTVTPTPPSTNPFTFVAELYSPVTGTFTQLANNPNFARSGHSATLLGDGTVLIAGGISQNGSGPLFSVLPAEIYNPATQTFTIVGSLNVARQTHTATLLANGQVLIASGLDNTAELYNPVTHIFTNTGNLNTARQNASATLLSSGKVLIAGGLVSGAAGIGTAELYDPVAGTFSFTAGGLNTPRGAHAATALPDGTVLVAGGFNCPPPSCTNPIQGSAEVYNPQSSTFTNTGSLINSRYQDSLTLLNDGTVLIAGGFSGNSPTATTERYYSTSTFGPMVITTTTPGQTGTTSFTNPTAFGGAAGSLSTIGFNGILPAGAANQDFNPLLLSGVSFFTPQPSTLVNVTTSTFYTPNYSADFIVDSTNSNTSNQLVITLPAPTFAVGLTYGALGFKAPGQSNGNITLSNGYVLPLSSLPTVGQTQFAGFVSGTPFTALTYTVNNDDWVLLNLQLGTANVTLSNTIQNSAYTQVLLEQGGVGALTWSVTGGTLPPGISLSAGGILHGTPTATGVFNFTVNVSDSSLPQKVAAAVNFTLTVVQQLVVTTTTLPNATESVPYTATILTSGGTPPIFFSLTNASFPPGLTITQPAVSSTSDTLAGTPTLAGIYNFTESVADSGNPQQMATQGYTITVFPQPATSLIGSPQGPGIITLTWTTSTSGDVVSYKVYRGISSGNYTTTINAGNTNSFVNTGLTPGTTYFFVVTAVSASGVESPFSNEVQVVSP